MIPYQAERPQIRNIWEDPFGHRPHPDDATSCHMGGASHKPNPKQIDHQIHVVMYVRIEVR